MKRFSRLLLLGLLLTVARTAAAQSTSVSCTATGTSGVVLAPAGTEIGYSVSGTFVGTAAIEQFTGSVPNGTWAAIVSTTSATSGTFRVDATGPDPQRFRINCSAYTSGTIVGSMGVATSRAVGLTNADALCTSSTAPFSTPLPSVKNALTVCTDGTVYTWTGSAWTGVGGGGTGAPSSAHYVTTQAEAGLSAEASLGALTTGLPKMTVSGGVATLSTAAAGTDYVAPAGNVATATALAANGTNCSAGQFPLGVDASGNAESCTALPTTIAGTANQITASAATGAVTLSIPTNPTIGGANITGVPVSTGISGFGTGVATALAANVGSAGAPVTFNGAGGTPSSIVLTNATGLPLTTGVTGVLPAANVRGVVQMVNSETGASATGTTIIPMDDTIPQNTEGDQYLSLAITPTSSSNKLWIHVTIHIANSANSVWLIAALFQDSTANALAAAEHFEVTGGGIDNLSFDYYMTAGTTSATTFTVRAGASGSGTTTLNGAAGSRRLGGVLLSGITIVEVTP